MKGKRISHDFVDEEAQVWQVKQLALISEPKPVNH